MSGPGAISGCWSRPLLMGIASPAGMTDRPLPRSRVSAFHAAAHALIIGALLFAGNAAFPPPTSGWIGSIIGALVALAIYRYSNGRRVTV